VKLHTKNIVSLFGFDALVRLLGFIATTYLARILGGGAFGLINLGLAVLSYGIIIASPGVHIIATRVISREFTNEGAVIRRVAGLRIALAILTFAVVVAASILAIHDSLTRSIVIVYGASLFPYALSIDWYFQGKRQLGIIGASRAVALLAFIAFLFLFIKSRADILLVPAAYFVNTLLAVLLMYWFYLRRRVRTSASGQENPEDLGWKTLLRQSIPVGAASFMGQAVLNFPIILLGVFATSLDIGYFGAASKFIFFLLAIDRAIYSLFYPLVARTAASNPMELGKQISRVLRYLFIIALPVCAGGLVLARPIVLLIFGSQYDNSAHLMQILLFYFLFTVLNSIFAYAVIAVGREKRYSAIIVTISVLLLASLVPLTFFWHATGACLGMVIGELLMMVFMYRECRRSIRSRVTLEFVRPMASSLLMGGVLFILPHSGFLVSLSVGMVTYFSALLLLKGITRDDILFLKERLV
jgi:O-antigen/teichoic acid export membrane protein